MNIFWTLRGFFRAHWRSYCVAGGLLSGVAVLALLPPLIIGRVVDGIVAGTLDAAGLRLHASEAFGRDYAETLRRWLKAFTDAEPRVRALGFDDRFIRMWRFYLCYCAAGFDSGRTDVLHFELSRSAAGASR